MPRTIMGCSDQNILIFLEWPIQIPDSNLIVNLKQNSICTDVIHSVWLKSYFVKSEQEISLYICKDNYEIPPDDVKL